MPRSYTTLSTRDPDYNKLLDLFRAREYENVLPRFIRYYRDDLPRRTDIEDKDRLTVLNNICESAYGCRRDGAVQKDGIYETFFEYFVKYMAWAGKTELANLHLGITATLLKHALEMLCERKLPSDVLEQQAKEYVIVFTGIDQPDNPLSVGFDALFQQAINERTQVDRTDYPLTSKTLCELFLSMTDTQKPRYRDQRVHLMNLLSDMASFETRGDEMDDQKALEWVKRCLVESPEDHFAGYRARILRQRISVAMQTRRFYHDANTRFADMRSLLKRAKRLAPGENALLQATFNDMELQIDQLDSARRLVQNRDAEPEEVFLQTVMARLKNHYEQQDPHLYLEIEPQDEARPLWLDAGYLHLTLERLLDNSAEAYERRRIPLEQRRVCIRIFHQRQQIWVSDRAGGIDPNLRDIFEPYVSSKPVKESTGLGLVSARQAMQKNRGTLTIAPQQPSGGTEFILSFNPSG